MNPRWHTFEPGQEWEEQARRQQIEAIESWWREFENRTSDLVALFGGSRKWDLPGWMHETLGAVHPELMWEFGPGLKGGHRLVITPEDRFDLRPLVDEILRRAPKIGGWSFHGHRLAEDLETARATVEARTGHQLEATGFRTQPGRFRRTDVAVEFPRSFFRKNEDLAFSQAFVLLESLLGESFLNAWVGRIEAAKKSWKSETLAQLRETVERSRDSFILSLPPHPLCSQGEHRWSILKMEPSPAEDYAEQIDLFVGKTVAVEMWQNAHAGVRFDSKRWSRSGETFCYLKIDGTDDPKDSAFEDKAAIEDALEEALQPPGLGCHIGGGTGLRYSYVDLALTDLVAAVPRIRETLQAGRMTKRSWILFFDSDWSTEWIGIWPDSPPPPKLLEDDDECELAH